VPVCWSDGCKSSIIILMRAMCRIGSGWVGGNVPVAVALRLCAYATCCSISPPPVPAALQAALRNGSASPQQLRQLNLDIATASRNLVKNQTTWFRDDDLFRWAIDVYVKEWFYGPWTPGECKLRRCVCQRRDVTDPGDQVNASCAPSCKAGPGGTCPGSDLLVPPKFEWESV
jgi:hypothetical protein